MKLDADARKEWDAEKNVWSDEFSYDLVALFSAAIYAEVEGWVFRRGLYGVEEIIGWLNTPPGRRYE